MSGVDTESLLGEWISTSEATLSSLDHELQAVCTALFLENTFGVSLTDSDIDPAVIGTVEGMRAVLQRSNGLPRNIDTP